MKNWNLKLNETLLDCQRAQMQIENRQAHTLFGVVTLFLVLISSKFYARAFRTKRLFLLNVTREKLREALLYKKRTHKMLMKLTTVRKFASNHPQHSWSIRRLRKTLQKCILLSFYDFVYFLCKIVKLLDGNDTAERFSDLDNLNLMIMIWFHARANFCHGHNSL